MTNQIGGSARKCFVVIPLAGEADDLFHYAIAPALQTHGYAAFRIDDVPATDSTLQLVRNVIADAELVVVDVTRANQNVYYELGLAIGIGRDVLLLSAHDTDLAFDVRGLRTIRYGSLRELRERLDSYLRARNAGIEVSPLREFAESHITIARSDIEALETELRESRRELEQRDAELSLLRGGSEAGAAIVSLRDDLQRFITSLSEDVIQKTTEQLVAARAEMLRLEAENQLLRSTEAELRRYKEMMVVNPHWKGRDFAVDADVCFVLMPFREPWSDDVWSLIDSLVSREGFRCRRADQQDGRVIMDDIWEGICRARVVIADLTGKNANVAYEIGLADVLGKRLILLSQTPHDVPFDFLGLRLVTYDNSIAGARRLSEELAKRLANAKPPLA